MYDDLLKYNTHIAPTQGKLLISEPLMLDSFFQRSVIYLCHFSHQESFGFILNKKSDFLLSELSTQFKGIDFPVFVGGPVETDSIHMLHTGAQDALQGEAVSDSVAWGGDLEQAIELIRMGKLTTKDIKFFLGYSGWGAGQLDSELDMNSWLVSNTTSQFVFETSPDTYWQQAIKTLGHKYKPLLYVPKDASLN